ncbi:MAG: hypothetical protein IKU19_04250, partial [Clostridia bacterium]|nr:hypothetical protein [Clostridia bacterium]
MSRRMRKAARKTPLSALDKLIYFVLWIIGLGVVIGVIVIFGMVIPNKIARSDTLVIACDNSAAVMYALPFAWTLFVLFAVVTGYLEQQKVPVFINKHYKHRSFDAVIPTYPLFSKDFSRNFSDDTKKSIKRFFCVMLVIVLITAFILPFGTYRRLTVCA